MIKKTVLACLVAAGMAVSAGPAMANDKVVLMLNWFVYGEHAPFIYGLEQGYFADEGIDLEIQEGRGSGVTVQAVAANTVDFGLADVGVMIKAAAKGAPVKSVGVMDQRTPGAIIAPKGKIDGPQDLPGKTIAITPGDAVTPILPLYLRSIGLDMSDIKTVAGDAQTKQNAVVNGQADGLVGFVTEQGARLPDIIEAPVSVLRYADGGVTLVSLGIVASDRTLQNRPDLVKRFMSAATRSLEAAVEDPQAAVDIMLEKYPNVGLPEAQLRSLKFSQDLYAADPDASTRPFQMNPDVIEKTLDVLVEFGGMSARERGTADDYFTGEFLP
ncbi:MAG: ABC transporter substrate-binding protein [Acuticoccus sp.]